MIRAPTRALSSSLVVASPAFALAARQERVRPGNKVMSKCDILNVKQHLDGLAMDGDADLDNH